MTELHCGIDVRDEVAAGCRVLAAHGQGDWIWGHVSLRDAQSGRTWMKRRGVGFEETRPEDVILIDGEGQVLAGDGEVHGEFPIHTRILHAYPEVNAVVHTHACNAVAFDALAVPLLPVSHDGALFAPDVPRFGKTSDLIRTLDLGDDVATALQGRNALILSNHGIVTVGRDVAEAVTTALFLERACKQQLLAMSAGEIRRWSDEHEAVAKLDTVFSPKQIEQAWAYLRRNI